MCSENKITRKRCEKMNMHCSDAWTCNLLEQMRSLGMEKPSGALLVIAGPTFSRDCNISLDPVRCISVRDGRSTKLYLPMVLY